MTIFRCSTLAAGILLASCGSGQSTEEEARIQQLEQQVVQLQHQLSQAEKNAYADHRRAMMRDSFNEYQRTVKEANSREAAQIEQDRLQSRLDELETKQSVREVLECCRR